MFYNALYVSVALAMTGSAIYLIAMGAISLQQAFAVTIYNTTVSAFVMVILVVTMRRLKQFSEMLVINQRTTGLFNCMTWIWILFLLAFTVP